VPSSLDWLHGGCTRRITPHSLSTIAKRPVRTTENCLNVQIDNRGAETQKARHAIHAHGSSRIDMASLIQLVLKASILLTVFAIGLSTRPQDVAYIIRRPGLLVRSLLSINIAMPLFAACMIAVIPLQPVVKIALIALSVSPIPPMLPKKARSATGDASYGIGLLVVVALLAIAFVPLSVHLLGNAFGRQAQISPTTIALILATNVLAPMGAGLLIHYFANKIAERAAGPISVFASVLLVASVLPILVTEAPAILSLVGNGTLLAVVGFVLFGLTVGHLLGGPDPANRAVLALTTASRHPGIAAAVASANFPQQKLAVPAILLYLILNLLISIGYRKWLGRRQVRSTAKSDAIRKW
jgi:bile acid:Na+ symporter, BASS family